MTGPEPEPWRGEEHPPEDDGAPWHHEWDGGEVWEDVEPEPDPEPPPIAEDGPGWPENCAGPEYWLFKRDEEDDQCA